MSDDKMVCRVKLATKDNGCCVMQLMDTTEGYLISISENSTPEIVKLVEKIIQQVKEKKQYEDKLVFWEDIMLALGSEHITFNELPNNDGKLLLNLDITTGEKLVIYQDSMTGQHAHDEIARNIASIVSGVFSKYGVDTVNAIEKALSQEDMYEAYKLLEMGQRNGIIELGSKDTNIKLFHLIHQIPPLSLTIEERKNLYEYKFLLGEKTGDFSLLYDDVSKYIDEFGEQAEPRLI